MPSPHETALPQPCKIPKPFVRIPDTEALDREFSIRSYGTRGRLEWEAAPGPHHQLFVKQVESSLGPAPGNVCTCFSLQDVAISLGPGTWRRPDLSIWRKQPPFPPLRQPARKKARALLVLPDAVVEVVSEHYEAKDLDPTQNPHLYLRAGIADVLVLDPYTRRVFHHTPDGRSEHPQGTTFVLHCDCTVTV